MGELFSKSRNKWVSVPDAEMAEAVASGLYEAKAGETVSVLSDGVRVGVRPEDLKGYIGSGDELDTQVRSIEDSESARKEREHGGLLAGAEVLAGSVADSVTFGGYNYLSGEVMGERFKQDRSEAREERSGVALAGEVAGIVGTALLSGGTSLIAKGAGKTALGLTMKMGTKVSAKHGRTIGAMAEGALQGLGSAVQEAATTEEPLSAEMFATSAATGLLLGGAIGGGADVLARGAGKALLKAKSGLKKGSDRLSKSIASSDKGSSREVANRLGGDVVDDAKILYQEAGVFKAVNAGDKKVISEGRQWLRKHLDDPRGLAENPNLLSKTLRKEEEVISKALANKGHLKKLAKSDEAIAKEIDSLIAGFKKPKKLKGKIAAAYGDLTGKPITRKAGVVLGKSELVSLRDGIRNDMGKIRSEAYEGLAESLESNKALQAKIDDIRFKTHPDLAVEEASGGVRGALIDAAVGGAAVAVLPGDLKYAAPILAMGRRGAGKLIYGKSSEAVLGAMKRTTAAVESIVKAGPKLKKIGVAGATKILSGSSFGPSEKKEASSSSRDSSLVKEFRSREAEIYSQVKLGPNGPELSPRARARVFNELEGVRSVSPKLADNIESKLAQKIAFLAEKLPKRNDSHASYVGKDNWRPSTMAIRKFARYVAAAEDPVSVFERVAEGSVTPEDAETVKRLSPEQFENFQNVVLSKLSELKASLSYEKRIALSIFTGIPVDPSMDPRVVGALQAHFAEEEGGGEAAPKAAPQFGSVKKSVPEPTPAQERAG